MVKRSSIIILTCCFAALLLGLILASPLLITNLPLAKKESLVVDVVYVYFGAPYSNQNISGLWRDYNVQQEIVEIEGTNVGLDLNIVPYFVVINITNISNQPIHVTNFEAFVGSSVSIGTRISGVLNPILSEYRKVEYLPGWDNLWNPNVSRLIFFSGIEGIHDLAYSLLREENVEINVLVEGKPFGEENVLHFGEDYKQISLYSYDQDFLYNKLLEENQTLIFYNGLDVSVGTRLPN